jgi:hypothetical protein
MIGADGQILVVHLLEQSNLLTTVEFPADPALSAVPRVRDQVPAGRLMLVPLDQRATEDDRSSFGDLDALHFYRELLNVELSPQPARLVPAQVLHRLPDVLRRVARHAVPGADPLAGGPRRPVLRVARSHDVIPVCRPPSALTEHVDDLGHEDEEVEVRCPALLRLELPPAAGPRVFQLEPFQNCF